MRIKFTHYQNSFLATVFDVIGGAVYAMGILMILIGVLGVAEEGFTVDYVLGIALTTVVMVLMGKGLRKVGKSIAMRKAKN